MKKDLINITLLEFEGTWLLFHLRVLCLVYRILPLVYSKASGEREETGGGPIWDYWAPIKREEEDIFSDH